MEINLDLRQLETLVNNLVNCSDIKAKVGVSDMQNGGVSTTEYAVYFEYGWVQKVTPKQSGWLRANGGLGIMPGMTLYNPPRPFFRYTIEDEHRNWSLLFKDALIHYVDISGSAAGYAQALQLVATKAVEDIQDTLLNGGSKSHKFPPRSPLTMAIYQSMAGGRKQDGTGTSASTTPGVHSMLLHDSIAFEIG